MEYYSHSEDEFDGLTSNTPGIDEHAKFFNWHYDFVSSIDNKSIDVASKSD